MSLLFPACRSVPDLEEAARIPHIIGVDYEFQEVIKHPAPQPWQTDIYAVWRYSDGQVRRYRALVGWDFSRDGRFEMVDLIDITGKVVGQRFDF